MIFNNLIIIIIIIGRAQLRDQEVSFSVTRRKNWSMTTFFCPRSYMIDLIGRFIQVDMRRDLLPVGLPGSAGSDIAFDRRFIEKITVDGLISGHEKTVTNE